MKKVSLDSFERQCITNRLLWLAIFMLFILDALWIRYNNMSVDISRATLFFPVVGIFLLISLFYRYIRRDDRLFIFGNIANQMLAIAAAIGVFSYLAGGMDRPFIDAELVKIDEMMLFDWPAYIRWVDTHAPIALLLRASYLSEGPQMLAVLVLLFFYNQTGHMQRFVIAFLVTACITVIISAMMPALGGYAFHQIDLSQYPNLHPAGAKEHMQALQQLRAHSSVISFPLKGVVMFPSFHAALALLLVYAALPIRWLQPILLLLNMLVLASTPVDGGHYLVDVLAGMAVALLAIRLADHWLPMHRSAPRF